MSSERVRRLQEVGRAAVAVGRVIARKRLRARAGRRVHRQAEQRGNQRGERCAARELVLRECNRGESLCDEKALALTLSELRVRRLTHVVTRMTVAVVTNARVSTCLVGSV